MIWSILSDFVFIVSIFACNYVYNWFFIYY